MPPKKKPLYKPVKSTRVGKKKMVYVVGPEGNPRLIHYGDSAYQDYTQHRDAKRRKAYLARSAGIKGAYDVNTANYWARKVLWKG